jgi:hypothetical protein
MTLFCGTGDSPVAGHAPITGDGCYWENKVAILGFPMNGWLNSEFPRSVIIDSSVTGSLYTTLCRGVRLYALGHTAVCPYN